MKFWTADRTFYPSVFRVLIGLTLLVDAVVSLGVTGFLFDEKYNAFLSANWVFDAIRDNYYVFYLVYILFLLLFTLDLGGIIIKSILFLFSVLFNMLEPAVFTWGDMILSFTFFYFIIIDSSRFLTPFRVPQKSKPLEFLSQLGIWSIIIHLFLVYLSNGYSKLMDITWQNGTAVYFAFGQYQDFESSVFYQILKNEAMAKTVNYFIIFFQITFPIFIMMKKTRIPFILVGILLHFMMMWQFGLWKFEFIIILLFGFLISDQEWENLLPGKIWNKFKTEKI